MEQEAFLPPGRARQQLASTRPSLMHSLPSWARAQRPSSRYATHSTAGSSRAQRACSSSSTSGGSIPTDPSPQAERPSMSDSWSQRHTGESCTCFRQAQERRRSRCPAQHGRFSATAGSDSPTQQLQTSALVPSTTRSSPSPLLSPSSMSSTSACFVPGIPSRSSVRHARAITHGAVRSTCGHSTTAPWSCRRTTISHRALCGSPSRTGHTT